MLLNSEILVFQAYDLGQLSFESLFILFAQVLLDNERVAGAVLGVVGTAHIW